MQLYASMTPTGHQDPGPISGPRGVANPVCGFQVVRRSANRSEPRPVCWHR
jgi:hypothetical protein